MRELSTPSSAYRFLLNIGLEANQARKLVMMGREAFEYFLRATA